MQNRPKMWMYSVGRKIYDFSGLYLKHKNYSLSRPIKKIIPSLVKKPLRGDRINYRHVGIALFLSLLAGCSSKPSSPELVAAVNRGDLDAAEKLLTGGANPDSTNSGGRETALLTAITRANVPMVDLLLKFKATPEALSDQGFSSLNWAAMSGSGTGRKVLIFRSLVKAGADINKKNLGNTPISNLANENADNIPVISEAVRLGADPGIKNDQGVTAIDKAIEKNLPSEAIDYMKNASTYKGKPASKFGNTEGMCKVLAVGKDSNPEGVQGMFFSHQKPCDDAGLASGVTGIFTLYDGTECSGIWSKGVLKNPSCTDKMF